MIRAQTRMGWFLTSRCSISETVRDRAKVTITNKTSYMGFRLQPKLMTLNDLERQFTALSSKLCMF